MKNLKRHLNVANVISAWRCSWRSAEPPTRRPLGKNAVKTKNIANGAVTRRN